MNTLIRTENITKEFSLGGKRKLRAVDNVSMEIGRGETVGLVGESGSGKSTLGRLVMRLYEADGGKLFFEGEDITKLRGSALLPYRSRMQMILQDPYSSLNPVMRIGEIIAEPLRLHEKGLSREDVRERVVEELQKVGMGEADYDKYPQEFSGGQRQRVGIARALIVKPDFVLCDEPISALDVSIQAQVVNLLEDMRDENHCAYLFVAHDLSMVRHISERMLVMYRGEILESAESEEVYTHPLHPYTQALIASVPVPNPEASRKKLAAVASEKVITQAENSTGCLFATRCPHAEKRCFEEKPALTGDGHKVACFCG
jgi:oligopeptide/dipeptide ABC transporter ATP-binding protein